MYSTAPTVAKCYLWLCLVNMFGKILGNKIWILENSSLEALQLIFKIYWEFSKFWQTLILLLNRLYEEQSLGIQQFTSVRVQSKLKACFSLWNWPSETFECLRMLVILNSELFCCIYYCSNTGILVSVILISLCCDYLHNSVCHSCEFL